MLCVYIIVTSLHIIIIIDMNQWNICYEVKCIFPKDDRWFTIYGRVIDCGGWSCGCNWLTPHPTCI